MGPQEKHGGSKFRQKEHVLVHQEVARRDMVVETNQRDSRSLVGLRSARSFLRDSRLQL